MSTEDLNRKSSDNRGENPITNEHLVKLEELCSILETDFHDGLARKHAKQFLKSHGSNIYSKPKQQNGGSFKSRILNSKKSYNWSKAEWNKVFNSHADDLYTVVREKKNISVKRSEIVPGDVCLLQGWQIVPADMRVISYEDELIVDNRIITGNTREYKTNDATSTDFLLSQNVLFAGTDLLAGSCEAIVLRTGDQTVFGELTRFAQKVKLSMKHNDQRPSNFNRHMSTSSAGGSSCSLESPTSCSSSLASYETESQQSHPSPPLSPIC